ncbi:MAG: hypothetical protein AAF488_01645 [Planctomycetota bacterium]
MNQPNESTTILYRPVGQAELDLIAESDDSEFPPRLPEQPIFYPVLNEDYAIQIARDWNTKDPASGYIGYVTRFRVNPAFVAKYERKIVGDASHEELWVPADELANFNANLVGKIDVIHTFRP